jgi:hypothetical protein
MGPVACVKLIIRLPSGMVQAPTQLVKPGFCGE